MAARRKLLPLVFLSHSHDDSEAARTLQRWIGQSFPQGLQVFTSCDSGQTIPAGSAWIDRIGTGLQQASFIVCLLTPNSINSKWLYFEAGVGHGRRVPVLPICWAGLDPATLPPPLGLRQGVRIPGQQDERKILNAIAVASGLEAPADIQALEMPRFRPGNGGGQGPTDAPKVRRPPH